MKKLNAKGMKTLKVFHLLFVMAWVMGVMGMWGLSLLTPESGKELSMLLTCILWIDYILTIPGAMCTVATGIVYGVFTNWGFFKQRWITVKWIVSILVILAGTFCFHPSTQHTLEVVKQNIETATENPDILSGMSLTRCTTLIQAGILFFLVVISVFKPWKQKSKSPKSGVKKLRS